MSAQKILIVEDSPEMQLMISTALRGHFEVILVSDSSQAIIEIHKNKFDLFILDIELPGEDGFSILSKIRLIPRYSDTPVFLVTGRAKTSDKVVGFSLGADDYLVKPVDPTELQVRVEAKLKRSRQNLSADRILKKGPFRADLERQSLSIQFENSLETVDLTPIEFKLFVLFLKKEDRILSREQILNEVWPQVEVTERTVDSHIYTLRRKLGQYGSCIEAVPRSGYRFIEPNLTKAS